MHRKQQGVVIILALFIMALVATMAYWMMGRLERDTYRTSLILHHAQAEDYAEGSIAWAMEQLRDNLAKQKPNRPVDSMPIQSPVDVINGYRIHSTITDMQGRFNLNGLLDAKAQVQFKRLLQTLLPALSEQDIDELGEAAVDWITPNQLQNKFSQYYLGLNPPYRAAHRMMMSTSELNLIKGMTPDIVSVLGPYVIALPTATPINVLTAEAPVLASLSETMSLDTGKAIEKLRTNQVIPTVEAFLALDLVKNHQLTADNLTTMSSYFLVETHVTLEKQEVVLYTLLERLNNNGEPRVHILWQSKGVMG